MLKHSGFVVALAIAATTAYAAALKPWTHSDVVQANNLFGDKSGLKFTVDPPDPDHPAANQVLRVHGTVVGGLDQIVAVTTDNPDPKYPPGPCFKAVLTDPPEPEAPSVVVHVLHSTEMRFVDANGQRSSSSRREVAGARVHRSRVSANAVVAGAGVDGWHGDREPVLAEPLPHGGAARGPSDLRSSGSSEGATSSPTNPCRRILADESLPTTSLPQRPHRSRVS